MAAEKTKERPKKLTKLRLIAALKELHMSHSPEDPLTRKRERVGLTESARQWHADF